MHLHRCLAGAVRAGLLCLLATGAWTNAAAQAPAPLTGEVTPAPAAPNAAPPSKGAPAAPSLAATLVAVQEISRELKRIDERPGALERSVAGVDASLKPVGALTQPDALQAAVTRAADVPFERARADRAGRAVRRRAAGSAGTPAPLEPGPAVGSFFHVVSIGAPGPSFDPRRLCRAWIGRLLRLYLPFSFRRALP